MTVLSFISMSFHYVLAVVIFFLSVIYIFCILMPNTHSVKADVLMLCFTMWGKPYLRRFIYNHYFLKVTCLRLEVWLPNDVQMGRAVLLETFNSVAERFREDTCLRSSLGGKDSLGTRTRACKEKSLIHTSQPLAG